MIGLILAGAFLVLLWGVVLWFTLPVWIALSFTLLLVVFLLGRFAWRRFRAGRAAREIESSLAKQAQKFAENARPDQQADIHNLQSEFDKAVASIKASKLKGGSQGALYALPWYVIIGPPGAGKSTALRNSGLKFPQMSTRGSVRGIGGTRNCDWWLTNEAVLLDTAGRYSTQDEDRDEWLAFLDMLQRTRPRRPVNGLILAVSADSIATANEAELEALSQQMRERVDEVIGHLRMVVPVYVLFTKCDLITGFMETFEDLRRTERSQVWGFTLPVGKRDGALEETVGRHFERLVQVVERRALTRAGQVRNVATRELIHGFPQQFESLKTNVSQFVSEVFVENIYVDAPLLRGVYFTSGTQEGRPIDRVMASMAAAFGLPPLPLEAQRPAEGKSYFLGELFAQVMFPDQTLAVHSSKEVRRKRWAQLGTAALLVLAAALFTAIPGYAYVKNKLMLHEVEEAVRPVIKHRTLTSAEPIALTALDPLRARMTELRGYEESGVPVGLSFGLYQGDELLPSIRSFYTSTLRSVLIEPLVDSVRAELAEHLRANEMIDSRPSVEEHARLYELLRAHLLLTVPREPTQPELTAELQTWLADRVTQQWARGMKKTPPPAEQAAMRGHASAYLELLAKDPLLAFPRDARLVSGARELLDRVPTEQLAIDRIVAEIDPLGWDLTLDKMIGSTGLPLSATGRVRGAFTRRAWDEYVRELLVQLPEELLGDAWVLEASAKEANKDSAQQRLCALRSEYFERYIQQWKQFVGTLRAEEPNDNARTLTVLQDLTRGEPPPIERVMRAVAHNGTLPEGKTEKGTVEKKAEEMGVLDRIRERLEQSPAAGLLARHDPCADGEFARNTSVRRALEGFFSFGVADTSGEEEGQAAAGGQLTSVQVYQEQLVFVRDALQTYLDDPSSADPLLARLQAARTRVRALIEGQEVGWRPRFDSLLWPPVNGASASSTAALAGEKGSQWCTSVALPYGRTLRGRYPFAKNGQDAALADLADFYRAGSGTLWTFYDSVLKRDVARIGDHYEAKAGAGVGALYEPQLVKFLNRSQVITDVLFPPRADTPLSSFEIRVRPSPGIASILLTVAGQTVDFHNGPEKWVPLRWPGEQPGATMRVKGAGIDETLTQSGEWGWFRMLDKGTIAAKPGERFFTARWRLRTQNDVVIDVRPARAQNPFVGADGSYLSPFRVDGVDVPRVIAGSAPACSE